MATYLDLFYSSKEDVQSELVGNLKQVVSLLENAYKLGLVTLKVSVVSFDFSLVSSQLVSSCSLVLVLD